MSGHIAPVKQDLTPEPCITHAGMFDTQVCVPKGWTDEQVVIFAQERNPCATVAGWMIRREGDPSLDGDPERNQCEQYPGHVHLVLDA